MTPNIELFSSIDEDEASIINNGLNALVVEDSKSIRSAISYLLKQAGFNVSTAVDGVEALHLFMRNNFDFIVTDLHMPKMDGYQLLQQISQISKTNNRAVRVLVSSSDSKKTTILKILEVAHDAKKLLPLSFLVKPWKELDFYTQTRNLFPNNMELMALGHQITQLNQQKKTASEETRLIIGLSETDEGIKIELGCDQELSLESSSISEYLDSLENAIFCAPVENYIFCLSQMLHQSAQSMVTLLLLIRGLADKHKKKITFVEAPPSIKSEVERQGLADIIKL